MNSKNDKILEHIVGRMRSDDSVDAPAEAIRYAKNLFRTRIEAVEPSAIRRLIAVIRSDLASGQKAFGERFAGGGQRQVLFQTDENAVDLRISVAKKGCKIRGQILGSGFAGGEAELNGDGILKRTALDAAAGFSFVAVPTGRYDLTIRGDACEIVIEKLFL